MKQQTDKKMNPQQISEKSWTNLVRNELSKEKKVMEMEYQKLVVENKALKREVVTLKNDSWANKCIINALHEDCNSSASSVRDNLEIIKDLKKMLNRAYSQEQKNMEEIDQLTKENERLVQEVEFQKVSGKAYQSLMQTCNTMQELLEKYKEEYGCVNNY